MKFEPIGNSGKSMLRLIAAACAGVALFATPLHAQSVETFDPDEAYSSAQDAARDAARSTAQQAAQDTGAIDADLVNPGLATSAPAAASGVTPGGPSVAQPLPTAVPVPSGSTGNVAQAPSVFDEEFAQYDNNAASAEADGAPGDVDIASADAEKQTYGEDDLIGAAEGVFGKGAEGVARMIQDLLKDQGEPNAYIVGREAGGAFIIGARYGSGTMYHKVEGEKKVYWTGPSIGLDAGANASRTFVLVYNLFDTEELYKRFPAGEGQAYLIGGMHASYMRKGDVVLIPIRVGAGVRLGVNAGYMKFSKKQRWFPF